MEMTITVFYLKPREKYFPEYFALYSFDEDKLDLILIEWGDENVLYQRKLFVDYSKIGKFSESINDKVADFNRGEKFDVESLDDFIFSLN